MVGTLWWMAPEIFAGGGHYDESCDVYSFAMLLVELFAAEGGHTLGGLCGAGTPIVSHWHHGGVALRRSRCPHTDTHNAHAPHATNP